MFILVWRNYIIPIFLSALLIACGGGSSGEKSAPNQAPIITVTAPDTAISGDTVTLNVVISEPEGQPTTTQWQPPSAITLDETTDNQISFNVPLTVEQTSYAFTVTVTDTQGAKSTKTVDIEVPAASVTLTTDGNFQVLKQSTVSANINNINLASFNQSWELNGEEITSQPETTFSYTPNFDEQGNALNVVYRLSGEEPLELEASLEANIPTVSVSFDVPYEPISLRYVVVNAAFENLDSQDVDLQWQITNSEDLTLENANTANLQFLASKQLSLTSNTDRFDAEQNIPLSLTLSKNKETLNVYNTSLTIQAVEKLPVWPRHEIVQKTNKTKIKNKADITDDNSELNCTNDPNFEQSSIKKADFNLDGFDDYFCLSGEYPSQTLNYYQSVTENNYQAPITLLSNTKYESEVFDSIQFFDINNNNYPEIFIPQQLIADDSNETIHYYFSIEQFEYDKTNDSIRKNHILNSPVFTSVRKILYQQINENFYFAFNYTNASQIDFGTTYPLIVNKSDIDNGTLSNPHDVLVTNCDALCRDYTLESNDIDGDGTNELLFSYSYTEHAGPHYQALFISTNNGDSFDDGSTCRFITRENIDEDNHLEWICKFGWWDITSEYLITIIDGEVQLKLLTDYTADLFFNHGFHSKQQDINNDQILDEIIYTEYYLDGTFSIYTSGSYIFYQPGSSQQRILLNRYCSKTYDSDSTRCGSSYGSSGIGWGSTVIFEDMDKDGDIDIKVDDEYWLENIESIPIIEAKKD